MLDTIALVASAIASPYGPDAAPTTGASHLVLYLVVLGLAWVLSLAIAFLLVRAGVREGVRELVEQNRQQIALLRSQSGHLAELVKLLAPGGVTAVPSARADGDGAASAWDDLGRR